jgi:hypothetical protein
MANLSCAAFSCVAACVLLLTAGAASAQTDRAAAVDTCIAASDEGQVLRDQSRYVEALKDFRTCAHASCPAIVQRNCARWADAAEEAVPTIVFAARAEGDGALPGDTAVEIDGVRALARLSGTPLAVNPGKHVFTFRRGDAVREVETMVNVGEKNRLVGVRFDAARATPSEVPAPPTAEHGRSVPIVPIALGSIGLAGIVAFGAIGGGAVSDLHGIERAPCANTGTCDAGDVRSVRTRFLVADIALVAGVACLVASGLVLWLSSGRSSTRVHSE